MIHIFNGVKEICALPGKACSAISDSCKSMDCKPIADCCGQIGQSCSQFTDKPLSSFVLLTWAISGLQLYYCLSVAPKPVAESSDCKFGEEAAVGMPAFLYVQAGFAVVNIIFAPWFQHQVWQKIMEKVRANPTLVSANKDYIPRETVQSAFKEVFLEDFGVLFYFFTLLGSFAWSWVGKGWVNDLTRECPVRDQVGSAAYWGMVFFWITFLYSVAWYKCQCCNGTVPYKQPAQPIPGYGQVSGAFGGA